jgi:TRAP-type C4-dicarboxylate transport system permease small subunit
MHALRSTLERIDEVVYRVEKGLVLVSLVMMTALVFADVLVRTFTRPVGKTASLILWLMGDVDDATRTLVGSKVAPGVFWLGMVGLCIFAVQASRKVAHERAGQGHPGLGKSAVQGLALAAGFFAAIKALLWLFPTSVDGAQKFALGFMVWSGFLGASMATRMQRHIVMDAVKKKLDDDIYPYMSFLGATVTSLFSGYLAALGYYKLWVEIEEWAEVPGVGVFEALPIPTWLVTLAIPVSLTTLTARFFAGGVSDLLWGPSLVAPADEISEELRRMEEDEEDDEEGPEPINALDYGEPHRGEEGRPVEREEDAD